MQQMLANEITLMFHCKNEEVLAITFLFTRREISDKYKYFSSCSSLKHFKVIFINTIVFSKKVYELKVHFSIIKIQSKTTIVISVSNLV